VLAVRRPRGEQERFTEGDEGLHRAIVHVDDGDLGTIVAVFAGEGDAFAIGDQTGS
jgi:hypothetical protein